MAERLSFKEFLKEVLPGAGVLAASGIGLLNIPYETQEAMGWGKPVGWILLIAAAFLIVWGFASLFLSSLAKPMRWAWRFIRRVVVWALRLMVKAYSAVLGFLLRPVILHALSMGASSVSVPFDWKADKARLYPKAQGADFKSFVEPGMCVRSISFRINPDSRHAAWRAGFRLGPAREDLERAEIRETLLFHLFSDVDPQPQIVCYLKGKHFPQPALACHKPSYRVNASIFSSVDGRTSHIIISVDDEIFVSKNMPSNYAEKVTLLAWADGGEFTVYFDSVTLRWFRPRNLSD